jgi:2-polyprenyl-3-methyl-5-hydroxy-6-metoxy-1,4-benzoquinol methylase
MTIIKSGYRLKKTRWGYRSVIPLPSAKELEIHYRKQYHQKKHKDRKMPYTKDELKYFENDSRVVEYIFKKHTDLDYGRLLDLGAGEGNFAKYFYEKAHWDVITSDFSSYGMRENNPALLNTLIQGDIYSVLNEQIDSGEKFHLINLKNVLEHVLDPVQLLDKIKNLLELKSLLRIVVPNDYSGFQELLLEKEKTHDSWFAPPEHLHYFNIKSLEKLFKDLRYRVVMMLTDFPIEIFLLNDHSNYARDREAGKEAHYSRVIASNFIFDQGIEKYIKYFSSSAAVDFGRQIIAYVSIE